MANWFTDLFRRRGASPGAPTPPAPTPAPAGGTPPAGGAITPEDLEKIERLTKKNPNLVKWAKRGAWAGLIAGLLAAGYTENFISAYANSKEAHRLVAEIEAKKWDKRTLLEKIIRKPGPKIVVGETWTDSKDKKTGQPTNVGKLTVLKDSYRFMEMTPRPAINFRSGKIVAGAALFGGAAGLGLGYKRRRSLENQKDKIKRRAAARHP